MLAFYMSMLESEEERESFAAFYSKHKDKCLNAALSITHNHAFAEDAVHEAFLKMIRQKEKYFSESGKRTGTLIVIMVKCAAIDIMRREKKMDHAMLDDFEPILDSKEPDAQRILEGKDAVELLQHHLSQLDEMSQTLFEMKYLLHKSDGEIAELVGVPKNTIAVRIHRLTKKLREAMGEECGKHG